jgi:hypothetical protein
MYFMVSTVLHFDFGYKTAKTSSSSSSMALQPGVGQSLLLLGFHPEGFLVGKCAFCSE